MKSLPMVFIGGHRKCGTTLFLSLFDSHPQLCVYPIDALTLYAYFPVFTDGEYTKAERLARLEQVVCRYNRQLWEERGWADRFDWGAMWPAFRSRLGACALGDIGDVLSAQLAAFRETSPADCGNARAMVVKETSIEIYANYLLNRFEGSRFLQLLRDPRDNYASLKSGLAARYGSFGDDEKSILMSLIHRYGLGMKLASVNRARFGEDRYRVLRFEDLVSEPRRVMTEVCAFLGVDFDDCLLRPSVMGKPTKGNNFENLDMSRISAINAGRWRERITDHEARIIEFHFGDMMEQYGYERAFDVDESAAAAGDFYKWANYRYFYSDHFQGIPEE